MTTALGIAKRLRLAFPEFLEVRIVREAPFVLHASCLIAPGVLVPADRLDPWIARNKMAGTHLLVDQVQSIPEHLDDEEALLRKTNVKRIVAEEA